MNRKGSLSKFPSPPKSISIGTKWVQSAPRRLRAARKCLTEHSLRQRAWLSHPRASLHSTLLTPSHGPSPGPGPLTMLHLWKIPFKPSTLSSSIQFPVTSSFQHQQTCPSLLSFLSLLLSSLPSTVHLSLKTITSTISLYSSPSISPALPLSVIAFLESQTWIHAPAPIFWTCAQADEEKQLFRLAPPWRRGLHLCPSHLPVLMFP